MPKFYMFIAAAILSIMGHAQAPADLKIRPIVGARLHLEGVAAFRVGSTRRKIFTPTLGIGIDIKSPHLSIEYQRGLNLELTPYLDTLIVPQSIFKTWEEDQIRLVYRHKKASYGLGHYWAKMDNDLYHVFSPPSAGRQRGFELAYGYRLDWLDIEFRSKIQYYPVFQGIVGSVNYSLLFLYRIDRSQREREQSGPLAVYAVLGMRGFIVDIALLQGEKLNKPVGIAPLIGVEFLYRRANLSLNFEKDWWLSFNGGSQRRDVKGHIVSAFAGIRYHKPLKNGHNVRFGSGVSLIEDNENKLQNITPNPTPEQQKLGRWQVQGIGLMISYEFVSNLDLELKTTIPLIGEDPFERISRTSLGLLYRRRPFSSEQD
jgi:hypothetical protein